MISLSSAPQEEKDTCHNLVKYLRRGEKVAVLGFSKAMPDEESARLNDLGFAAGIEAELGHRAPFGGPCVFRFHGVSIAVRGEQMRHIYARKIS